MSQTAQKMASPQWKNFQPPDTDPAILSFQRPLLKRQSFETPLQNNQHYSNNSSNNVPVGCRETGIVEKLLHSYGFVQCCERDARLFFHFSEYSGNDTLKLGDSVEFQMSYDKRTGKPIAVGVSLVEQGNSGSVMYEILSPERVTGMIASEAKPVNRRHSLNGGPTDGLGRVSYESSGEWFFVPFGVEDYEDESMIFKQGDKVTFFVATDKRNGSIRARKIQPVQERHEGVVCSMKDSFGFIERADVVKEIFFHYSEFQGDINELILGDDVDFVVQTRNGKEVAVDIKRLPEGTVIFEDVSLEKVKGKVQKTLRSAKQRQSDPLAGRIVYQGKTGSVEIPFGDKDQKGDYTLQVGDLVEFNIATDRRDKLQRATNIQLMEESFKINKEKRECGVVATLKEGYGFIKCADRDARMFFHFSEVLNSEIKEFNLGDEVEFTVIQDPSSPNREIAIRINLLPKGTISFETVSKERFTGVVDKEPATHKSPSKNNTDNMGIISYENNGTKQQLFYQTKGVMDIRQIPRYGDKVEFNISESKRNSATKMAITIKVLSRNSNTKQMGFIATLKENFGFIETAEHDKEIFFHFSSVSCDPNELDLGDEVEYVITKKSSKVSAENIKKLQKGTVSPVTTKPGIYRGKIERPMRIVDPDQEEYSGLVRVGVESDPKAECYPYGISSLADKRDFLQKGDIVKFQLCKVKSTGQIRATNVAAERKYIRAKVDSVKGQYGFISYEAEGGKKLFFHMSEVHDGVEIQAGHEVEFVVVQNQRSGKYSACSLRKICETSRPERLLSRLKSTSESEGPKIVVLRQPKGPDGTNGFKQERILWKKQIPI